MKHQWGFTFIELIITVSLISVLGLMTAGFYSRFFLQNAVANTEDQLVGELRKAQIYSMMGKQNGSWGVHILSSDIVLFQGSSYAGRNSAFDEKTHIDTGVTISGYSDIIFTHATGLPNLTPTVTFSGGGNTKSITINNQGVVSK